MSASRGRRFALLAAALLIPATLAWGWNRASTRHELWQFRLDHTSFGPIRILAIIDESPLGGLRLRSSSAALEELRALPAARQPPVALAAGSWAFALSPQGEGYRGASLASRAGDGMLLQRHGDSRLSGSIDKGWFRGDFTGVPHQGEAALRDYPAVLARLRQTVEAQLYDPARADSREFRDYLATMDRVARLSRDDVDLLLASRLAWSGAPAFSHFELRRSELDADSLARQFDAMEVGGTPVTLEFRGQVAILGVSTMFGRDTYAQIEAAMRQVVAHRSRALIIDLRGNPGGAFAVGPLIEPLLEAPFTAGVFVSRRGKAKLQRRSPDAVEIAAARAWKGDSLVEFWRQVQAEPLLRVDLQPSATHFGGRVAVLIDGKTESAAELAAQALQSSRRALLIGEKSPGRMLSAAYFDLGDGFQVYLPVADYLATGTGSIEGRGVTPGIEVAGAEALERALLELSRCSAVRSPVPCAFPVPAPAG